jgi:hypothetical protein
MAKLYTDDEAGALAGSNARAITSIDYECPFQSSPRACGGWCGLFEIASHQRSTDGASLYNIRLNCGAGTATFAAKENVGDTDGQVPIQEYPGQR